MAQTSTPAAFVRPRKRSHGFAAPDVVWLGSNFDGAFAQFVKVPAAEIFAVDCAWSDAELGTIPCAYGTAENMIHRAKIASGEHVLVAGASGGVGSAAVQLAKRRGARVTAIAGSGKAAQLKAFGADQVIDRYADPVAELGGNAIDVVVDNVAGPGFGARLKVMKRGGRAPNANELAMSSRDARSARRASST